MKKAALWVLLIFSGACCFAWLSSVWADGPDDPPEFFFTRLAYSENPTGCCRHRGGFRGFGGRGSLTMPIPPQFVCPEFGGRNFFPRQGWGWGTDYPGGDCKFMGGIHRLTGMRVAPNPHVIGAMDPDLFKFPFLYAVEVGGMYFNTQDAARIREYQDVGIDTFIMSGYPHLEEAYRFAELVFPLLSLQQPNNVTPIRVNTGPFGETIANEQRPLQRASQS